MKAMVLLIRHGELAVVQRSLLHAGRSRHAGLGRTILAEWAAARAHSVAKLAYAVVGPLWSGNKERRMACSFASVAVRP
jgi:hypothetical protein